MAHRAGWLVIALVGVLLIAGLALVGRDIRHFERTGPKWRRRLLGAGLAVLGLLGFRTCVDTDGRAPSTVNGNGNRATTPGDTPQGRAATTGGPHEAQAGHVASGGTDPRPARPGMKKDLPVQHPGRARTDEAEPDGFDREARMDLVESLASASREIEAQAAKEPMGTAIAELLKPPLAEPSKSAQDEAEGFRLERSPYQPDPIVCYAPLYPFFEERQTLERLLARLPLLEKVIKGNVRPDVARKALASIENDLKTLAGENVQKMPEAERLKVEEVCKAAEALAARLKATLEK